MEAKFKIIMLERGTLTYFAFAGWKGSERIRLGLDRTSPAIVFLISKTVAARVLSPILWKELVAKSTTCIIL